MPSVARHQQPCPSRRASLEETIRSYLVRDDLDLPVFSKTCLRLQQLIEKDQNSARDFEKVILADQVLTARILRAANSAFYRGLRKVDTIRDAIVRLGIEEVLRLAVEVSVGQAYRCSTPLMNKLIGRDWQHSLGVALGAHWLARKIGAEAHQRHAFLAGLMHDIGRVVVFRVLDEIARKKETCPLSRGLVLEAVEALHVEQGYRLMKAWEIPEVYQEVVRKHHTHFDSSSSFLVHLVQVADCACNKLGIGLHYEPDLMLSLTPAAEMLHLKDAVLAELEIMLEDRFKPCPIRVK